MNLSKQTSRSGRHLRNIWLKLNAKPDEDTGEMVVNYNGNTDTAGIAKLLFLLLQAHDELRGYVFKMFRVTDGSGESKTRIPETVK